MFFDLSIDIELFATDVFRWSLRQNQLTADFQTCEDCALALISKALREDVLAIKEIFDSAYGRPKTEEAQFEPWTVIMPKPVSERE